MSEPLLKCPNSWIHGSLEPDPSKGLIVSAGSGSTPDTDNDDYWDGDIPWLTPKEIASKEYGIYVSQTERKLTKMGLQNSTQLHPPGTVLLTKRAPVGIVAVNTVPMAVNQGFIFMSCGSLLRQLYLAYWLRFNRPYLELVANGSTYPELYIGDLFEFEIAVPSVEEQDKILEIISALQFASLLGIPLEQSAITSDQLTDVQEYKNRLTAITDRIIPLLLSGEIKASHVKKKFLNGGKK